MHIAPIKAIDVFDVQTLKDRTQRTIFSLRVDGTPLFSKAISGSCVPSSGTNTTGAFRNENKDSLFAWIDPVSGDLLVTTGESTFKPAMLLPGLVFVALTLIAVFAGLWPMSDLRLLAIPVLLGALVAVHLKERGDRTLETALRSALTTN